MTDGIAEGRAETGRVSRFLVNRDFARLWYGQAISSVGDLVFDTTLTLWIATKLLAGNSWAPAAVSGLMLCAFAATMVIGPLAGVFVDRWSHRRTMLVSEVIRGALVGLLALVTLLPSGSIPVGAWLVLLYLVVIVVNSAGQFFNPARFATIGEIVTGEAERAKAFGLGQATAASAAIFGPPLAAPLLFAFGIRWAMFLNAASYVVSFIAIRSVRFPASDRDRGVQSAAEPARPAWHTQFGDGLKMFVHNRYLVALLCVAVVSSLGTGALTALMVFFVSGNLHVAAGLLGVMWMAYGAGAVVGALISGRLTKALSARRVTWLALLISGALLLVFARQTHVAIAVGLMFAMAIPVAAMNAGLSPQLLAVTPKGYTGRMIAVLTPVVTAASMISVVLAGSLASTVLHGFHASVAGLRIGPIDTIFTVSALLIVAAGVFGYIALPPAGVQLDAAAASDPDESGDAVPALAAPSPTN
jgi:MFS family permease